jgi:alpha-ketoglutarate-dependent taurine dioxygenase
MQNAQMETPLSSTYEVPDHYVLECAMTKEIYLDFVAGNLDETQIVTLPLHAIRRACPAAFAFGEQARRKIFDDLGAVYIHSGVSFFKSHHEARRLYLFMSRVIGSIDPLYGVLYDVKSKNPDPGTIRITVSQTSGPSPMHTDGSWLASPPDTIGLLCLSPAMTGGENELIHSHQILNYLERAAPSILESLREDFYRESASPGFEATREEVEKACFPVLQDCDDHCTVQYMRRWIEEGHAKTGRALTAAQVEALDTLDRLLCDPTLIREVPMKEYDMVFTNNKTILHTRRSFKDFPDEAAKRHMVRVWIKR